MKRLILTLLILSTGAIAGIAPRKDYASDLSQDPKRRGLIVNQGSDWDLGWRFHRGGTNIDLSAATSVVFTFTPRDYSWSSAVTGAVETATNGMVLVGFEPSNLNTNGGFRWDLFVSSATETLGYAYGDLTINRMPAISAGPITTLGSNIVWSSYNFTGTGTYGPYTAGTNVVLHSTGGQGQVSINVPSVNTVSNDLDVLEARVDSNNVNYVTTSNLLDTTRAAYLITSNNYVTTSNLLDTTRTAYGITSGKVDVVEANYAITSNLLYITRTAYAVTSGKVDVVEYNYAVTSNLLDVTRTAYGITSGKVDVVEANYATSSNLLDTTRAAYLITSNLLDTTRTAYLGTSNKVDVIEANYATSSNLLDVTIANYAVTSGKLDVVEANYAATSNTVAGLSTNAYLRDGTLPLTANLYANGKWLSNDGDDEGVFVDTSGNVGIGTNSLSTKFEVSGGDALFKENMTIEGYLQALYGLRTRDADTAFLDTEWITYGKTVELLGTFGEDDLYGATNAHPVLTGAASMWDDLSMPTWTNTTALSVGANYIGTWYYTNAASDLIPKGTYQGHWHHEYDGNGNPDVVSYFQLVISDGTTTNILATSEPNEVPATEQIVEANLRHETNYVVSSVGTWYLGVKMFAIRTGGSSASYIIYGGDSDYDTALTTPNLDGEGAGDMRKAVYDTDNDGVVDNSEALTEAGQNSITALGTVTNLVLGADLDGGGQSGTNFIGLTLESSDAGAAVAPTLKLYRNSASPAAEDDLGTIRFAGEDSNGNEKQYARIYGNIEDPISGQEDGRLYFATMLNGFLVDAMRITGDQNLDMMTHSITNADNIGLTDDSWIGIPGNELLTFDAAGDITFSGANVGIGIAAPSGTLHVAATVSDAAVNSDTGADDLIIESSGNGGMVIAVPDAAVSTINFANPSDGLAAQLQWNYTGELLKLRTRSTSGQLSLDTANGTSAVRIDASQNVGIGTTTPASLLHVDGAAIIGDTLTVSNNVNMLNNSVTNMADPTADQDAATKKYVDDNAGGGSAEDYIFVATRSSNLDVTSGAYQKIVWQTVVTNSGGAFDLTESRYNIPTNGTYWFVFASYFSQLTDGDSLRTAIYVNGAQYSATRIGYGVGSAFGAFQASPYTVISRMTTNDYVDSWMRHTETGTQTLLTNGSFFAGGLLKED